MLSVPKILLFIAIAGAVFAASRLLRKHRSAKSPATTEPGAQSDALDLSQCSVCGKYVAAGSAACERIDCPHST